MQYLILIYSSEKDWESMSPADGQAMMADFAQYTAALHTAGVWRGGERLTPVGSATTVRMRHGKTLNTDGPFAETKEQLGGYYLIEVADLDAALGWAARCPAAPVGSIEVRAIWPRQPD